ncbi:MAG: YggT family protein [Actinomycetota bacterium]
MLNDLFSVIQGFIAFVVMVIIVLMIVRMIFNYTDPNPFGTIGRISYRLKKSTDRIVYPSASLLARLRIDTRVAPLLTILAACVVGYFTLQLFGKLFMTIDGVTSGIIEKSITHIVGWLLFGFLGIYSLLIVIRIVFSWVMDYTNRIFRFLARVTDPILEPFRRMIPPLGVFDISAIVVLLLLWFLQTAVYAVLLSQ